MRLTYTDLLNAHFRYIGEANNTNDSTLLADFQYSLGQRYQMVFGSLSSYINQSSASTTTVANQQYYYYPVGTVSVDSATIAIGNVTYTLFPIYDQQLWNFWNTLQVQPTAIPQFIFPRKDDFGVWPIPTDAYTLNFQRFFRDRNLLVADYTSGTVTMTSGSSSVTGSSTTWTSAMAGRWLTITDTSVPGQGYWYRIASVTNSTTLTLETDWAAATTSGATYRIGETPEIPEEGHVILPWGTASDFYAGLRNDAVNAAAYNNLFWTGDAQNSRRDMDDKNVIGGLIGLIRKYSDRERDGLVRRQPPATSPVYKIFAEQIL